MAYSTKKYSAADSLTLAEIAFLQDLAFRAGYDADNIALISQVSGVQVEDISSQFDGLTTTFTIPEYSNIVLFILTGWPPNGALRPTVDFTEASSTTVSLTSEVSAPINGSTGIILYVPA